MEKRSYWKSPLADSLGWVAQAYADYDQVDSAEVICDLNYSLQGRGSPGNDPISARHFATSAGLTHAPPVSCA